MSKIYRESLAFFLASFPVLLAAAALMEGLLWVTGSTSDTGFFGAMILAAYLFHRHFLFGEAMTFSRQPAGAAWSVSRVGTFLLVSVGVVLVPLILGLILTFAMFDDPPFAMVFLVMMALYLLALGLFGLWLHALQAGIDRDALVLEKLIAFKRAGCSGVLTYHAAHVARLLNG